MRRRQHGGHERSRPRARPRDGGRFSRRAAIAEVNRLLAVATLGVLVRWRAQARVVSPTVVLVSAGALRAPSRKGVAAAAAMGAPPAAAVDTCVGAVRAGARRSVPPPIAAVLYCVAAVDARADARVADLPHGVEWFEVLFLLWDGALRQTVLLLNFRIYGYVISQHMLQWLAALEGAVGPAAG